MRMRPVVTLCPTAQACVLQVLVTDIGMVSVLFRNDVMNCLLTLPKSALLSSGQQLSHAACFAVTESCRPQSPSAMKEIAMAGAASSRLDNVRFRRQAISQQSHDKRPELIRRGHSVAPTSMLSRLRKNLFISILLAPIRHCASV